MFDPVESKSNTVMPAGSVGTTLPSIVDGTITVPSVPPKSSAAAVIFSASVAPANLSAKWMSLILSASTVPKVARQRAVLEPSVLEALSLSCGTKLSPVASRNVFAPERSSCTSRLAASSWNASTASVSPVAKRATFAAARESDTSPLAVSKAIVSTRSVSPAARSRRLAAPRDNPTSPLAVSNCKASRRRVSPVAKSNLLAAPLVRLTSAPKFRSELMVASSTCQVVSPATWVVTSASSRSEMLNAVMAGVPPVI